MRRRAVPNAISKRFRRKLARYRGNKFHLYLRCKRPAVWARLTRLWQYRFLQRIVSIAPFETPLFSLAPRLPADHIMNQWMCDPLPFYGTGTIVLGDPVT